MLLARNPSGSPYDGSDEMVRRTLRNPSNTFNRITTGRASLSRMFNEVASGAVTRDREMSVPKPVIQTVRDEAPEGMTPLAHAAKSGDREVVELLLEAAAAPEKKSPVVAVAQVADVTAEAGADLPETLKKYINLG